MSRYLTTGDVSRALNCSPEYVRYLVKRRRLRVALTVGKNQRLFSRRAVEKLARERSGEAV